MKRMRATIAIAWLAAMAAVTTLAAAQVAEAPPPQAERIEPIRWSYPVVRIGQNYTLKAGDPICKRCPALFARRFDRNSTF